MTASRFDTINLAALPAPAALETLAFEAILDARMADYVARWKTLDPAQVEYDVATLETDPAKIGQRVDAFREVLVRARVNDAVLATSLAYAEGDDLTVIAAGYQTKRQDGESDDSLRRRAQLAWENLSLGGSYGGYAYQALSAAPVDLADVAVYGHETLGVPKGEVRVVCLGAGTSGVPSDTVLQQISKMLTRRDIRKVNDLINVQPAMIHPYTVDATLHIRRGVDPISVVAAQTKLLDAYAASRRAISAFVTPMSVAAKLGHDNAGVVVDITLRSPLDHVGGGPFDVPVMTGRRVVWEYVE